jgi:hypothetical protein
LQMARMCMARFVLQPNCWKPRQMR